LRIQKVKPFVTRPESVIFPTRQRRSGLLTDFKPAELSPVAQSFADLTGDLIKALMWDGQGLVLYAKRLERGRFVWPQTREGVVTLTAAQLSMLAEGIDWRMPAWTVRPEAAV
jgi:transposase